MRKKVIKAHQGMAHVPRTGGQRPPTRPPTKGRGRPPTGRRMIGLPQKFRGGGRRPNTQEQNLPAWAKKASGGRGLTQAPKISPKVAQPIPQDSPMKQPKAPTTGNPYKKGSHNYEVYEGRGGRKAFPTIYKPPTQTPPIPVQKEITQPTVYTGPRFVVSKPIPRGKSLNAFRTVNKGGYISRAKYGIVDNLKKGK
jgi:hypothetical protein